MDIDTMRSYKAMKEMIENNAKISRIKWTYHDANNIKGNKIFLIYTWNDRMLRYIIDKDGDIVYRETYDPKHDDLIAKDWYIFNI
jgi:hypothetical protein